MAVGSDQIDYLDAVETETLFEICAASPQIRFGRRNEKLESESLARRLPIILLAAGDSDVLSTIREQKHLLHHRSHCRYRDCPQSAPRVLAQGWIYLTAPVIFLFPGPEDSFLASKN